MKIETKYDSFEQAKFLADNYKSRDLNEADTRHQIIDLIVHKVLAWPESLVGCESYIRDGYADYIFKNKNNKTILIIEAKKEGTYFNIPGNLMKKGNSHYIPLKVLLTDSNINKAIIQVKSYCIEEGTEYAAISNGHEWIFFKTFEKSKKWSDIQAFVIFDLKYFHENYTDALNNFGFHSIIEKGSLASLLGFNYPLHRSLFNTSSKITSYNHEVNSNRFTAYIKPLSKKFFGIIDETNPDFMAKCYVNQRDFGANFKGVRSAIEDSLSPYFKNYEIKNFSDDAIGGILGEKVSNNVKYKRSEEVIIMFGGKGCGKSTFIRKLLYYRPPNPIKHFAKIAIVDLLNIPEDKTIIYNIIWEELVKKIDADHILSESRDKLLSLYSDKYNLALKQDLFGLDQSSDLFNAKLNDLIIKWKNDKIYTSKKLADYWKRKQKGIIVVVDNTDQFSTEIQDFCFTTAQQISQTLDCLVIISLREERFQASKIRGTLDAFQKNAFHLSSALPHKVFIKRIDYILNILKNKVEVENILDNVSEKTIRELCSFFDIVRDQFVKSKYPLNTFLNACTHGDLRKALDMFTEFLISGYTNVDEMISRPNWHIQIHQVLKPMMIPYRFFYDENKSSVPNIYKIRSNTNGSHFTGLRILSYLDTGSSKSTTLYIPVSKLRNYFADNFNMVEDFELNLDVFLIHGIVESDNRLDSFSEEVDSIKITPYGSYFLNHLSKLFTYLELICIDCEVSDESFSNFLVLSSNKDLELFLGRKRFARIKTRLEKAEKFINYLKSEEKRELELYSIDEKNALFSDIINNNFTNEKVKVLASAERNQ